MFKIIKAIFVAFAIICLSTPVNAQSVTTTITPIFNTGTISGTQSLVTALNGQTNCAVQISGTWTGQVNFNLSLDGSTYGMNSNTDAITTTTVNGYFNITCAGARFLQVIGGSVTGTATITVNAVFGESPKSAGLASYNSPVNVNQVAGVLVNTTGLPILYGYPAFANGGGCAGVSYLGTTGTQINRSLLAESPPSTQTQFAAASSPKVYHICSIYYAESGTTTAGSTQIVSGTGSNCATGQAVLWYMPSIVNTTGIVTFGWGDGQSGLFDAPSGAALCIVTTSVATRQWIMVVYALY